jgi:hypothetical protein
MVSTQGAFLSLELCVIKTLLYVVNSAHFGTRSNPLGCSDDYRISTCGWLSGPERTEPHAWARTDGPPFRASRWLVQPRRSVVRTAAATGHGVPLHRKRRDALALAGVEATPAAGSRTLPVEGMALTIQSVGKCVQDLIFGEMLWIECQLMRCDVRLLSNYVENRLVSPRVSSSDAPPRRTGTQRGGRPAWASDGALPLGVARCH